jgi:hypothetical protein
LGGLIGKLLIGKTFEVVLLYSNDVSYFSQILIYVCLATFSLILGILLFKYKYRANFKEYLFLFFFTALYLTIKFELNIQEVVLWPVWENLGLIDCFFVVLFTFLISSSFWNYCYNKNITSTNLFLEDSHNGTEDNEESYSHLISQIEPILFEDHFESSFSVGIVGSWGIGKSSLIKSIERKIIQSNRNDIIFFKFSPTLNHNQDQLINEFFLNLSNNLKYRNGFLSKDLKIYSSKLVELLDKKGMTFLLNTIFPNDLSILEYFEKISAEIKKQDLRIIISIDDLDRLSPDEIFEVLKLIRNTSNFPNTVFLVALDKEYVIDALKQNKDFVNDRFLDKYFQLELHVSKTPEQILFTFLEEKMEQLLVKRDVNQSLRTSIILSLKNSDITNHLLNYRDVKKFINQFILDYCLVNKDLNTPEIDFVDLIRITLIKILYPKIFKTLVYNKDIFTNEFSAFRHIKGLVFMGRNTEELKKTTLLSDFSGKDNFNLPDDPNELKKVSKLLIDSFALFFSESDTSFISQININSIKNESVYKLYFERTFSSNEISLADFNTILSSDIESIDKIISNFNRNKIQNLIGRLFDFMPMEAPKLLKKLFTLKICIQKIGQVDQNILNHFMSTYRFYFIQNGLSNNFIISFITDVSINKFNRSKVLKHCFDENGLYNLPQEFFNNQAANLIQI